MTSPGVLLEPGDIYTVDPKEMYLLRKDNQPFTKQKGKSAESPAEGEGEEASASETTEEASASETANEPESTAKEGDQAVEASETSASEASTSTSEAAPAAPAPAPSKPAKEARPARTVPGQAFSLPDYAAPFIFLPAYLEVSFPTCSGIYVRHPTARPGYSEIASPFDADGEIMRFGWEFYKGVGRRRRGTEDWGDKASHDVKGKLDKSGAKYDDKGRRIWAGDWEEFKDQKRLMRGVREGRGRWAHRPL